MGRSQKWRIACGMDQMRGETEREKKLSHSRLCEVLNYDAATGIFRWATRTSNRIKVGDVAGQIDRHGHRSINVDGLRYMAHRLAWFHTYDRWPVEEIDHINLVKDDNRIANLREASRVENCCNSGVRRHNKLGIKGVSRHAQAKHRFQARIRIGGKVRYLGLFDTAEEAHDAYIEASAIYHGTFARVA